jgi:hypothetical protein
MLNSEVARREERRRVREHLLGAEGMARRRRVPLDPLRTLTRALLLEELAVYRRRGRFPLNHERGSRARPEFVDPHGTRCAVAHLMDISGQSELVRHVADTNNHGRVRELARLPELRAWLAASGLSLDEAARIQPSYCFVSEAEACFCHNGGLESLGLGTVLVSEQTALQIRVDRLVGEIPGVELGAQLSLADPGPSSPVGDQVLFTASSAGSLWRVGPDLAIRDNTVRCQVNADTARRPISVDTAFEAFLAENPACVSVLEADDSAWNRSQCGADEESAGGCAFAMSGLGGAGLTTVAVLAAVLSFRRRRRKALG